VTTRLLLRAPKDPFEVASPERTLEDNLIGNNSGNLIFIEAAYKLLATRDTEITADHFRAHRLGADRINERFDGYVITLANAFRPSFRANLVAMTRLIEQLRIPVVVLGVGAQATAKYDPARLASMADDVRAFMRAVLDRSPSVGVRGEFTYDYLRDLGFHDVEVIGCPSMFVHGDGLQVTKRVEMLTRDSPLAMNVSPYVKAMGPLVMSHLERYPDLRYIAQDVETLELLLWGDPPGPAGDPPSLNPVRTSHPLFQERKTRFYVDPWPWIESLREVDFSFGTRIHGNIAALLAGTPAFVLAHDSRTLELARYFEIPHRLMADVTPDTDAAELYQAADYGPLVRGHPARFSTFTAFLGRHGLHHVYEPGEDPSSFDRQVEATPFPAAVGYSGDARLGGLARRTKRLAGRVRREARRRGSLRA
jgi:hypothetical protein